MSVFGRFGSAEVADAAEKFVSKMDERDLAAAIEQSGHTMQPEGRSLLVEAIFDAFRGRGESSEDVAEASGAPLDAMKRGDESAVRALHVYAKSNPGLLKEAVAVLVEAHPELVTQLSPALSEGIANRLLGK
jgi:hypothetical protein